MAIWQWDIWIVPRKEVIKIHSMVPHYMDLNWFESIDWWNSVSEAELVAYFSSVLPDYYTPWAKNTRSWGSDNENRIELSVENGKIIDVAIRLDLRDLNINFLHALVNFSESKDFLFYSLESNRFIEPDLIKLFEEIKRSRKMVFLRNPEKFFEDNKKYLDNINKENRRKLE